MSALNRHQPEQHTSIFDGEQVPSHAGDQIVHPCGSELPSTIAVGCDHNPSSSSASFLYSDLKLVSHDGIQISYNVKNAGREAAAEGVQIYVRTPEHGERLVGWEWITLKPGQQQNVTLRVDMRLLAKFDTTTQLWIITGAICELRIASLSDNKRFSVAELPNISTHA